MHKHNEETPVAAPRNREEAEATLATVGRAQQVMAQLEAEMNAEIIAVKESFESHAAPLRDSIEVLFKGLHQWAHANREELLGDGTSKTVKLATGELSWRWTPSAVTVKGVEKVIESIESSGFAELDDFIRVTSELDKEAILKDRDTLEILQGILEDTDASVTITQREEFIAKPHSESFTHAELKAPVPKLKKKKNGGAP